MSVNGLGNGQFTFDSSTQFDLGNTGNKQTKTFSDLLDQNLTPTLNVTASTAGTQTQPVLVASGLLNNNETSSTSQAATVTIKARYNGVVIFEQSTRVTNGQGEPQPFLGALDLTTANLIERFPSVLSDQVKPGDTDPFGAALGLYDQDWAVSTTVPGGDVKNPLDTVILDVKAPILGFLAEKFDLSPGILGGSEAPPAWISANGGQLLFGISLAELQELNALSQQLYTGDVPSNADSLSRRLETLAQSVEDKFVGGFNDAIQQERTAAGLAAPTLTGPATGNVTDNEIIDGAGFISQFETDLTSQSGSGITSQSRRNSVEMNLGQTSGGNNASFQNFIASLSQVPSDTAGWDRVLENDASVEKVRDRIYKTDNLLIRNDNYTQTHLEALDVFSQLGIGAEVLGKSLTQDGDSYVGIVATQYVPGTDLQKKIIASRFGSENLDKDAWAEAITDAASTIHNAGWLHSDVKTDQILGTPDDLVLIDLESAQTFDLQNPDDAKEFRNEIGRVLEVMFDLRNDDEELVIQDMEKYLEKLSPELKEFAQEQLADIDNLLDDLE